MRLIPNLRAGPVIFALSHNGGAEDLLVRWFIREGNVVDDDPSTSFGARQTAVTGATTIAFANGAHLQQRLIELIIMYTRRPGGGATQLTASVAQSQQSDAGDRRVVLASATRAIAAATSGLATVLFWTGS